MASISVDIAPLLLIMQARRVLLSGVDRSFPLFKVFHPSFQFSLHLHW
jgi:hypothetical protein